MHSYPISADTSASAASQLWNAEELPAGSYYMRLQIEDGNGLRGNGRKTLSYSMLKSLFDDPDGREPGRTVELHLTGHMEKFAWSFDGAPAKRVTMPHYGPKEGRHCAVYETGFILPSYDAAQKRA